MRKRIQEDFGSNPVATESINYMQTKVSSGFVICFNVFGVSQDGELNIIHVFSRLHATLQFFMTVCLSVGRSVSPTFLGGLV